MTGGNKPGKVIGNTFSGIPTGNQVHRSQVIMIGYERDIPKTHSQARFGQSCETHDCTRLTELTSKVVATVMIRT